MKKQITLLSISVLFILSKASAVIAAGDMVSHHHEHHNHTAHLYSPIGIMGDHPHKKGELMASYRYSYMNMQGNLSGDNSVSTSDILGDFLVAPKKMTMDMQMFGLMYGFDDKLTIMGMLPYMRVSMLHENRMGREFTTKSEGIGDVKISGLYTICEHEHGKLLLNMGLSIPTGSINERDDTPAGSDQKLPYPMQLGSGTYDMLPKITYNSSYGTWSWGTQLGAVIRTGENSNGYTLGNKYNLSLWGVTRINNYISTSLRFDGNKWENIDGYDAELNAGMVPTARTDMRAGERIDILLGVDISAPYGKLAGNRLAIEAGAPVYQRLDGPQLETDYRLTIGWQKSF